MKKSEITEFVNSLQQSILSEKQTMTIAVLPDIEGGTNHNKDCTNTSVCDDSRNRSYCVNQSNCTSTVNKKICDNQATAK